MQLQVTDNVTSVSCLRSFSPNIPLQNHVSAALVCMPNAARPNNATVSGCLHHICSASPSLAARIGQQQLATGCPAVQDVICQPGFQPRPFHVGFVVNKVAQRQVSSSVLLCFWHYHSTNVPFLSSSDTNAFVTLSINRRGIARSPAHLATCTSLIFSLLLLCFYSVPNTCYTLKAEGSVSRTHQVTWVAVGCRQS
jgi:hypothetical protein